MCRNCGKRMHGCAFFPPKLQDAAAGKISRRTDAKVIGSPLDEGVGWAIRVD